MSGRAEFLFNLNMGPLEVPVHRVEELCDSDGKRIDGCCETSPPRIDIDRALYEMDFLVTLIHEAIHLAEKLYGLKFKEREVECLSMALTQVLRPFFVPFWPEPEQSGQGSG